MALTGCFSYRKRALGQVQFGINDQSPFLLRGRTVCKPLRQEMFMFSMKLLQEGSPVCLISELFPGGSLRLCVWLCLLKTQHTSLTPIMRLWVLPFCRKVKQVLREGYVSQYKLAQGLKVDSDFLQQWDIVWLSPYHEPLLHVLFQTSDSTVKSNMS